MSPYLHDSYIEITLPLSDEAVNALSETKYAYLLNELKASDERPYADFAYCEMLIAFSLADEKTFFTFNTVLVCTRNGETFNDISGETVDFDPETAEYFKKEAVGAVLESLSAMYR